MSHVLCVLFHNLNKLFIIEWCYLHGQKCCENNFTAWLWQCFVCALHKYNVIDHPKKDKLCSKLKSYWTFGEPNWNIFDKKVLHWSEMLTNFCSRYVLCSQYRCIICDIEVQHLRMKQAPFSQKHHGWNQQTKQTF